MGYFTAQELSGIKNEITKSKTPTKKEKPRGRGGFISSLISEAGGTGGALGGAALGASVGSVVPGIGTAIGGLVGAGLGGFLGGTGGRVVENKVRDDRIGIGDALKEGAISGVAGAGPLKLLKGAGGAIAGAATKSGAVEGAEKALGTSFLGKVTGKAGDKVGKRLTEAGSGLKADPNVGGVERLKEQSGFMSKYTGTPRQQRVKMETDMKDLSKQVDDVLTKTPIQVDGSLVGQRLKEAATDLTDSRYLDLDLNNPSVSKIIDRYSEKFAQAGDAKGVNDIVKTLNKTATRAQNKLLDERGGVLTAQEQAALALKRAGDDVLGEIPEIAPLKKNMAQIFEVTPQVAKQGEKGISSSLVGGLKVKAPVQAASGVASRVGGALQGTASTSAPGTKNFATRILAGAALTDAPGMEQPEELPTEEAMPNLNEGQQATAVTADDILAQEQPEDTDPYSAANIQATVKSIIAQGGTQKDVAEFLSNAKAVSDLTATGSKKPMSAEAAKVASNASLGLTAISDFQKLVQDDPGAFSRSNIPGKGFLDDLTGGRVSGALGTSGIDAAGDQIVDVIARLRTGAAISKQEEERFKRYIPRSGDTPDAVKQKLGYLSDQFSMVLDRTGASGTDLQSSLGA